MSSIVSLRSIEILWRYCQFIQDLLYIEILDCVQNNFHIKKHAYQNV